MACVNLKRSLDFDPLHNPSRSAKRRRCIPVPQQSPVKAPSAYNGAVPKMTQDQLLASVREEVKRLQRRKQLSYEKSHSEGDAMCESGPSSPASLPRSPSPPNGYSLQKDKPLFTLKQVTMICERMIREREEEIREAYDQVLVTKLAEQYDSFVKFTFDQVQRRFEAETPSYLS
jgi:hypothetical protein